MLLKVAEPLACEVTIALLVAGDLRRARFCVTIFVVPAKMERQMPDRQTDTAIARRTLNEPDLELVLTFIG